MSSSIALSSDNYLPDVRTQYESLPYPPYDVAQDKLQLVTTNTDRLDYLNHRFFNGSQRYGKDFRVLCAGDGTGHSSIFLGEQMFESGGQVVSLDLSSASQAIAKERATMRKLTNITHIHASLLDIPKLGLGQFDYIVCSGVLHHLADPDAGLKALVSALKPGGVLAVMVYGQVARTGVYYMQDMLRLLFGKEVPMEQKLEETRSILANLPRSNWFWHNNAPFMNDITKFGNSGIFDLLLHSQDRAYTVPQLYEWTKHCGLHLAEFCPMAGNSKDMYNPLNYIDDPEFKVRIESLPLMERQAIAELLAGTMNMHIFFAMHEGEKIPDELSPDDRSLIPVLSTVPIISTGDISGILQALRISVGKKTIQLSTQGGITRIKLTPCEYTADLLEMINGARGIGEIIGVVAMKFPQAPRDDIAQQFRTLYDELYTQQAVALRRSEGALIPQALELQQRSFERMKG